MMKTAGILLTIGVIVFQCAFSAAWACDEASVKSCMAGIQEGEASREHACRDINSALACLQKQKIECSRNPELNTSINNHIENVQSTISRCPRSGGEDGQCDMIKVFNCFPKDHDLLSDDRKCKGLGSTSNCINGKISGCPQDNNVVKNIITKIDAVKKMCTGFKNASQGTTNSATGGFPQPNFILVAASVLVAAMVLVAARLQF